LFVTEHGDRSRTVQELSEKQNKQNEDPDGDQELGESEGTTAAEPRAL
jgi:hypothetical protein